MSEAEEDRRVAVERALVVGEGVHIFGLSQRRLAETLGNIRESEVDELGIYFFRQGVAIMRVVAAAQRAAARASQLFAEDEWPTELVDEQVFAGLEDAEAYSFSEYVRLVLDRLSLLDATYQGLYARLSADLDLPALDFSELSLDEVAMRALLRRDL
jgi:hypothetical protein